MKPGVTLSDDESTEIAEPSKKKRKTTAQPKEITDPQEKSSNSQQANTVVTPSSFETFRDALLKAKANPKELLLKQKSQHSLTALEWVVLGCLHENGIGTDKNPKEAFTCYKTATDVDKTYAPAWFNLGWRYRGGIGADKNPQEAFACYKRATEVDKTYAPAWNNLGCFYEDGIGTDKNPEQALACYKNSMQATPSEYARVAIARIEGKLAATCTNPTANTRTPSSVSLNANKPSQHSHTPSSPLTFWRSMPSNSTSSISPPYEHLKRENDLLRQENKILRERIELLQTTQVRPTNTFRS